MGARVPRRKITQGTGLESIEIPRERRREVSADRLVRGSMFAGLGQPEGFMNHSLFEGRKIMFLRI